MERRSFPRLIVCRPVRLEVRLAGREFRIDDFDADGLTVNISRGGLMVDVNRRIAVGSSCTIYILNVAGEIAPEAIRGTVRHTGAGEIGWQVGVEFERPLEILQDTG